jgi:hypothetical protein
MKNKKPQFLSAVRILAPNDTFILNLAERVREADLPPYPGGATLEFVAVLSRLREASREPRRCRLAVRTLPTASTSFPCRPPARHNHPSKPHSGCRRSLPN